MDYTKQVFLKLLANCICEEKKIEKIDFEKLDSEELIRLSRVNTVTAIVYSSIKDFDGVPSDLLETLKNEFMRSVLKISKYNTVLGMVAEKLNDADFPYALVKGKTIAKYYPSEELRNMSDLDILVSPDDYEKAKTVFGSFCKERQGRINNEHEHSYVLNDVTIELQNNLAYHKDLSGRADYKGYFGDLINHRIKDGNLSVIEPSYSFIYTIFHMAQHFYYAGCGVRMIVDVAVLIKHFANLFDWDEIIDTLEELKLNDFAMNVFSIIDEWFEIRIPSSRYEKRIIFEECQEYFIDSGIFGKESINSDVENVRRTDSFFKWAFPSYSYMREHSDWFKNKPAILLPTAYIVRIAKGLKTRGGVVKGISVTGQTKRDYNSHKEIVGKMGLE